MSGLAGNCYLFCWSIRWLLFGWAIAVLLSSPAVSASNGLVCVSNKSSQILENAVSFLAPIVALHGEHRLRTSTDLTEALNGAADGTVPVYAVCDTEHVGIYFIGGIKAVFFHPQYVEELQRLTTVDVDFVAAVRAAISRTDRIPEGMMGADGIPGKEFALLGMDLMNKVKLEPKLLLSAMILHELGHIHQQHRVSGKTTDADRKLFEGQADQFAADYIARALHADGASQVAKSAAYLLFHHLSMVGFRHAGERIGAGRDKIEDAHAYYEDWELRIFRMLLLTAQQFIPGTPFAKEIERQLDELLLARGDISPGEIFAKKFVEQLQTIDDRDRKAAEIEKRLEDPAMLSIDPEKPLMMIELAQHRYYAGDYRATRDWLAKALDIVTKLGQRRKVRGVQILGPLAVMEALLGNDADAMALCDEVLPLLAATSEAPIEFSSHVQTVCSEVSR